MMNKDLNKDLTIVILAGGRSSRMGCDKGFLKLGNHSFVEKLVGLAQSITPNVVISVSEINRERYASLRVPLVVDNQVNLGPLGGICTSLQIIKSKWFALLSIDTPFVTEHTIKRLWENRLGQEAVVFSQNNRIHPLVGLYQYSTKKKWLAALNNNHLRVTAIVESFDVNRLELEADQVHELKNINTPQQYKAEISSQ